MKEGEKLLQKASLKQEKREAAIEKGEKKEAAIEKYTNSENPDVAKLQTIQKKVPLCLSFCLTVSL